MALPQMLRAGLVPSEAEYLSATATHVAIVPLQRMDRVRLFQGVYGPFRPPTQAQVPLWLAVNLKGKRKARIVAPEWLSVGESYRQSGDTERCESARDAAGHE